MNYFKHFISLGEYCAPAQVFQSLNIRDASYPFDWLYSTLEQNVKFIIEMIETNSISSVYEKYITFLSKDVEHFDRNIFNYAFPHESSVFNDEFKEKSKRRIERLFESLHSKEPICFVFSNRYDTCNKEDFLKLFDLLSSIGTEYKCIIFHGDESLQINHPNCICKYYYYPKCPNSELVERDAAHKKWMAETLVKEFIVN